MPMESGRRQGVVAIECVAGGSRAEEWGAGSSETVQTGDVVEELLIGVGSRGGPASHAAPFKGGRAALQKLLHAAYKRGETSVEVRVRRSASAQGQQRQLVAGGGDSSGELVDAATEARMQACIVPQESVGGGGIGRSRQYVLRSIRDPNYAVGLVDRMESECIAIRGSRSSRVVCALSKAQLQDGYVSYPWEKKMREVLPIPNSNSFLSLLILPMALDRAGSRYNSVEDTLARANAWILSSQASGVPIAFLNVQTEALLTKISGETASSTVNSGSLADLPNLANASLYGFEDYHGVDIGVVKAVRVWYTAAAGEMPVEIILEEGDARLGFAISRTEEGFIYVSSVVENDVERQAPSTRSGLRDLYREAKRASKLLVISRVSGQKVLPWMVSTSGALRCFDTVSLSQKLSLHRHALRPILLHVLMWDGKSDAPARPGHEPCPLPLPLPSPEFPELPRQNSFACVEQRMQTELDPGVMHERDTAGDASFRFHNFSLPNNWV